MSGKLRVGILGATGTVGQRFVQLLDDHPQFEVTALAGSDRSRGKPYADACVWRLPGEMPESVRTIVVEEPLPNLDCDFVFSSLPGEIARDTESLFRDAGYPVISNSSAFRMDEDVPLLVPEVNPDHLALIDRQLARHRGGFIVTNPNCVAIGVALAIAGVERAFGIDALIVTTLQAISGAGYPGVASLDITDNIIPFIRQEEEKLEIETRRILGTLETPAANDPRVVPAGFAVSAQCHRVPVTDGHTAAIRVKLERQASLDDVRAALESFTGSPQKLGLHSAPPRPVIVRTEEDRPQPRLDRDAGRGMSVTVGRLFPDAVLDFRFVVLSHNTIRGAAGASILNAELLVALDKLPQRTPNR